ncbi:MAG TPA: aldehyde dehydrogenase family protein [Herpetosiphonaceae bacterium]
MSSESTIAEIKRVFAEQQANRWAIAASSASERIARLERLRLAIIANRDEISAAIHADFRKHRAEVELTEIHQVLEEVNHIIEHLPRWMEPSKVGTPLLLAGTRSEVRYEPKGLVLILSPWNYPFGLLMAPLAAAIAAGNCVILRPSEKVPHIAACMERLLSAVFPANEVALFTGDIDVADALLELPFDHIFFTGSTAVGKKVMAKAAQHLAGVTLELGGKSPVIVDRDANLAQAAQRVCWGKMVNAGQTCVAPDHVWVHQSQVQPFVEQARKAVMGFYGKTERDRAACADFPRVIDQAGADRLRRLIEDSVAQGARLELGGAVDIEQRYVAPTILSQVTPDQPVMAEEIFGPVLPILAYDDLDEAISYVRGRGKPLAMYVFSNNEPTRERLLRETSAGNTVINNVFINMINPYLPFGGVGESGCGNYHGFYGFRTLSHERSLLVQGSASLAALFQPPYDQQHKRLAAWVTQQME